jgi:sulfate transport system ATP-binding protein
MRRGRVEQIGTPQEIFEHPANAFVMDFLGNVNVFHGRVQGGRVRVGEMEVAVPEYAHADEQSATLYVRPHEREIDRTPGEAGGLEARVLHVNAAGSVAKVQLLVLESRANLSVELSRERLAELALASGEHVYVFPRRVRVFLPDYSI